MSNQISSLDQLIKAREDAREILQELHGTIKDCKRMRQEIFEMLDDGSHLLILKALNESIEDSMQMLNSHMEKVIKSGSDATIKRFNELATVLEQYGDSIASREESVKELSQMVRAFIESKSIEKFNPYQLEDNCDADD